MDRLLVLEGEVI